MSEPSIDAHLDAALAKNRLRLALSTGALLAVLSCLVAISDREVASSLGLLGFGGLVMAFGIMAVDGWTGAPRPAPRRVADTVVIPGNPLLPLIYLLGGLGIGLITTSFLVAPGGLAEVADGGSRRAGLYLTVAFTPLLVLGSVFLAARRDGVTLHPDGVRVRRFGRDSEASWSDIRAVYVLPDDPGQMLRITHTAGPDILLPTRQIRPTLWEMRATLVHFAENPGARARLDGIDGVPPV